MTDSAHRDRMTILRLRNDALRRADRYWVDVCNEALDGDAGARLACLRAAETRGHEPQPSATVPRDNRVRPSLIPCRTCGDPIVAGRCRCVGGGR